VGLVIGFVEGVVDTIAGLGTLVGDLGKLIAGDAATRRKYGALWDALVRDPLGTLARIFEAIIAPIVTDWQAGRYGEAIGRAVFELLPAILAIITGGMGAAGYAAKAGSAGKTADALADAGRTADALADAGRTADALADAGRAADTQADAGRAADTLADVGRTLNRVDDIGRIAQIKGFATPQKLSEHFKKHGAEFGFTSESEYLAAAQEFASSQPGSDVLVKIRANGNRVIYNVSTNEFAVVIPTMNLFQARSCKA